MIPLADFTDAIRRKLSEVRPGMERVVGELMVENAAVSRDMIGQELPIWPPLAPSTIAEKERLGYVGHISSSDPLLRTGELRDSIQPVVHEGDGDVVGEVGTDLPYAKDQEYGTVRIPARPFISPPFITMEPRAAAALGALAKHLLDPSKAL